MMLAVILGAVLLLTGLGWVVMRLIGTGGYLE